MGKRTEASLNETGRTETSRRGREVMAAMWSCWLLLIEDFERKSFGHIPRDKEELEKKGVTKGRKFGSLLAERWVVTLWTSWKEGFHPTGGLHQIYPLVTFQTTEPTFHCWFWKKWKMVLGNGELKWLLLRISEWITHIFPVFHVFMKEGIWMHRVSWISLNSFF